MLLLRLVFFLWFNTAHGVFREIFCTLADTCECDFEPDVQGKTIRYTVVKRRRCIDGVTSIDSSVCLQARPYLAVLLCDVGKQHVCASVITSEL